MAVAHDIIFRIGSAYSGEGLQKTVEATKKASGSLRQAAARAQKFSSAFSQLDTSCNKTAAAVSGMMEAVLSFNASTIILQAGITAINWYVGKLKDRAEAATKRMNDLKAAADASFNETVQAEVAKFNDQIAEIANEFERITAQANAFTAAMNGLQGSVISGGIINLQIEKVNAMLEAQSDAARQTIESQYNLKIAIQKAADAETIWAAKRADADKAVTDARSRVAMIGEQLAISEKRRVELENELVVAENADKSVRKKLNDELANCKKTAAKLTAKQNAELAKIEVLLVKRQQAEQDAINAQNAATLEIRNAELAERRLNEARDSREEAERKAKEEAEAKAAAAALEKEEQARLQDATKTLADAQEQLAKATAEYERVMREYTKDTKQLISQVATGSGDMRGGADVKGAIGDWVKAVTDQAVKNGEVRNLNALRNLEKQAGRQGRDAMSSEEANQEARDARYLKQLESMNPKTMNARQKKDLADLQNLNKKKADEQKAKDDAAKAKQEAEKAAGQAYKDIASIKGYSEAIYKQLEKLGLQ